VKFNNLISINRMKKLTSQKNSQPASKPVITDLCQDESKIKNNSCNNIGLLHKKQKRDLKINTKDTETKPIIRKETALEETIYDPIQTSQIPQQYPMFAPNFLCMSPNTKESFNREQIVMNYYFDNDFILKKFQQFMKDEIGTKINEIKKELKDECETLLTKSGTEQVENLNNEIQNYSQKLEEKLELQISQLINEKIKNDQKSQFMNGLSTKLFCCAMKLMIKIDITISEKLDKKCHDCELEFTSPQVTENSD
jgi:hypothetical protein